MKVDSIWTSQILLSYPSHSGNCYTRATQTSPSINYKWSHVQYIEIVEEDSVYMIGCFSSLNPLRLFISMINDPSYSTSHKQQVFEAFSVPEDQNSQGIHSSSVYIEGKNTRFELQWWWEMPFSFIFICY